MDPSTPTIQYVRVDHRGLDVLVPQEFLVGRSWKYPLPSPLAAGIRVFSGQRVRQGRLPQPAPQIGFVLLTDATQVVLERLEQSVRQHRYAILRQESVDVILGQFARMSAIVKQEEAANPVEAGLLGTAAVMPSTQDFYHAVVERRR